jgi:hypothetical protein
MVRDYKASKVLDSKGSEDISMLKGIAIPKIPFACFKKFRLSTNVLYLIPDDQIHSMGLLKHQ